MNIFVLDESPVVAAQSQCDKHVVKMVLETAQLLCSAFPDGVAPYKKTHVNHPCAVWTRESLDNFMWLGVHGSALAAEYELRYGKRHKSEEVIAWCLANHDRARLESKGLTPFALAMPEEYKDDDAVLAYRRYYRGAKAGIATWKVREVPAWFQGKE